MIGNEEKVYVGVIVAGRKYVYEFQQVSAAESYRSECATYNAVEFVTPVSSARYNVFQEI